MHFTPIKQCTVVAELSTLHFGLIDNAKKLIDIAQSAGAQVAKFQKRNPDECVSDEIKHKPHPNPRFAYGETYLEHRKNLELSIDQHKDLKDYCEMVDIKYSTSVWDLTSAREVVEVLNPEFIKIPSACNNNFKMMKYLYDNYEGDVHVSTGMATAEEKNKLFFFLSPYASRTVIYHCTSEYPVPFERMYLLEIQRLKEMNLWKDIGFSNHGYGISCDAIAMVLGANWIERHLTHDRCALHSDAAASLEKEGFSKLCRDLKAVQQAMQFKNKDLTEEESVQRSKLKLDHI